MSQVVMTRGAHQDAEVPSGDGQDGRPSRSVRRTVMTVLVAAVTLIALGNLAILAAVLLARHAVGSSAVEAPEGIQNFRAVQPDLWRGGAPTQAAYGELAERGVGLVVDLRAEATADAHAAARDAGMEVVWIPIRDGQPPTAAQVDRFTAALGEASGPVYVHCQAGVGRTGSMVAAYLIATGQATPRAALADSLSVGPPSLEQIAVMATSEHGQVARPPLLVVATSRLLDAPRRIWHSLGL